MRPPSACAATAVAPGRPARRAATFRVRRFLVALPFGRPGPRFAVAAGGVTAAAFALVALPLGRPGPRFAGGDAAATFGLFLLPLGLPRFFGAADTASTEAVTVAARVFLLPRGISDSPSSKLIPIAAH